MSTDVESQAAEDTGVEGVLDAFPEENYAGYDPGEPAKNAPDNKAPDPQYFDMADDDETQAPSDVEKEEEPTGGKAGEVEQPKPLSRTDWAQYGLSEDQARELDGRGELNSYLSVMDQVNLSQRTRQAAAEAAKPSEAAVPAKAEEPGPQAKFDPLKLEFDFNRIDEDDQVVVQVGKAVEYVNKMAAEIAQMRLNMDNLGTAVKSHSEAFESQTMEAFTNSMDEFFDGLGDEYAEAVGKGAMASMPENSPQAQTRLQVNLMMNAMKERCEEMGVPVPAFNDLRMQALRAVCGDKAVKVARREEQAKQKKAASQFTAKPTRREGAPVSPEARAARNADRFYAQRGLL